MKKYKVKLYYRASIEVEVTGENYEDAIEYARTCAECHDYDQEILNNLQEDSDPDVYQVLDKFEVDQ